MDVVKVDPFQNVAVSSKAVATWRPPAPLSLFGFVLVCGGTFDESDITSIKVKAGGKEIVPGISGAVLRDIYEYEGVIYDADHLPILFGDPTARTFRGKHIGNFDHTIYPGNLTIEVDIDGTPTAPTLDAYALIMPPKLAMGPSVGYSPAEAAMHRALINTVLQTSAAVTDKSFDIGIGSSAGALLKRIMFDHANLTRVTVKKQGLDIWEGVGQALADYLQDDLFTRVPQAGWYVYDAIVDGDYSEVKSTVKADGSPWNYQIRLTTSAADTINAYADVLTSLPLL